MKKIALVALLGLAQWVTAQTDTKTLVVENTLADLKTYNKYNLNEYTKSFLEKEGFVVFDEKDVPSELANNRCNAYYVNYEDDSTLFTTALKMTIKDCTGKLIYESEFGKTREKDYRVAYREVFRNVAKNFQQNKNRIVFTDTELIVSKPAPVKQTVVENVQPTANKTTNNALVFDFKNGALQGELKDANQKVLYKITKTSVDNLYMASNPYVDGIIYSKNNKWYFEFTKNGEKIIEEIK
ncbi:hypothetical protein K5I29_00970 [Flavobacterium agricola]|uniref:Uncharacterized protein n=1 Tax=Flavobacterium agricola TaxID=2870839 RepID=A0ABY6M3G7_9FLAO|nr:hypothetical protein [Flavobacterium agricola]UYW01538.1 hypothetical protein K5I29_00970 [Flavobacterium agricola]